MFVAQHLFGLETLQEATPDEGAQDAPTQTGLHLSHSIRMNVADRVEDDAWRYGLAFDFGRSRHFLKHPIDPADVEVHMLIEAGAETVDKGYCADVQARLIRISSSGAVGLKALGNGTRTKDGLTI